MIEPRIDELLGNVDSRYALVIVAAKRARQINSYHHQLGEGMGLRGSPPPLIESRSKNYLTMAMEEIAQGKIAYEYPARELEPCPLRRTCRAQCGGGTDPPRDHRRHRRLQGVRARPAARQAGHDVEPLPTPGAERFVAPRRSTRSHAGTRRPGPYPHLRERTSRRRAR